MRQISNKEVEVMDLERLFAELVEPDMIHHSSDSTPDQDLTHLFDLPSSNESEPFGAVPIPDWNTRATWHKALEDCQQNPIAARCDDSIPSFHVSSAIGKQSHSDSELLSFDDIFEATRNQLRSISQPSTPRPHTPGRSVKKAVSFHNNTKQRGITKQLKKSPAVSFAKMMQPSYHRSPIPDVWTRKAESVTRSLPRCSSPGIVSPPLSSKLDQQENSNGFFAPYAQPEAYTHTRSPNPHDEPDFSNYQLTPSASPAISISGNHHNDQSFNRNMNLALSSSSASRGALSALQTPPPSLPLSMTTWGPETSPGLDFSFSASPEFSNDAKAAKWWDDQIATSQPCPSTNLQDDNPRCASQNMGLGITCDSSPFDFNPVNDSAVVPAPSAPGSFEIPVYGTVYPTLSHPHQQHADQIIPIGRPISRSPSPYTQPRFHRRRPSTNSHPHHRTSTSSQRRKSSNGSVHSSRQMSSPGGSDGFVNFTPDDSRKILTGVAPSGSSKTKARREKEAADKRRKISQAAMKAVMEAGGDINTLRKLERDAFLALEG
ncbi:developmental regulatory [Pyrenophora seminiperda CCB06]|uniref:Developmental regulatory protein wetA n=1 Tax=Pyrenophora seminiperda CCB06 TaxID=1302712 RepID=A0A3M7LWF5_9PLEO|nr:developmental regulatory [Pyrenophora seminiperda CCB06]